MNYDSQFTPTIVKFLTHFSRLKFLEVDNKVIGFKEYKDSINFKHRAVPSLKTLAFECIQNQIDEGNINKDDFQQGLPDTLRASLQILGYGPRSLRSM